MVKKIKSFTVEEDAYDALVRIFKESGTDASVSLFVNKCLKELSVILENVDKELKQSKQYTVPMSFIIKSIVESNEILGIGKDIPDESESKFELMLREWHEEYEAKQQNIPVEFIPLIKGGLYSLSPNKRYLIEKETGKRYISGGKGQLMCVDSPEIESQATRKATEKKSKK